MAHPMPDRNLEYVLPYDLGVSGRLTLSGTWAFQVPDLLSTTHALSSTSPTRISTISIPRETPFRGMLPPISYRVAGG
jgi:hypothetical protein